MYSVPSQTSNIFEKDTTLDVLHGSDYVSDLILVYFTYSSP